MGEEKSHRPILLLSVQSLLAVCRVNTSHLLPSVFALVTICPSPQVYWDLEHRLLSAGFDFCYDKTLYDR